MKVPLSLRTAYAAQRERNEQLAASVRKTIENFKYPEWHFEDRVKGEESFALKIESGRFPNPERLDDFFACTIVVRSYVQIPEAVNLIDQYFQITRRKPAVAHHTASPSNAFGFEDLRIYAKLKPDPMMPPPLGIDLEFEIQIKTLLQHAWTVATHDLVYKTDEVNWPKERIAYQIKAMLEHAELSIDRAAILSQSAFIDKSDVKTKTLSALITFVKQRWSPILLPRDIKRLSENIQELLKAVNVNSLELSEMLDDEEKNGRGAMLLDVSPYGAVFQTLINQELGKVLKSLTDNRRRRRLMVPRDLSWPSGVDTSAFVNVVFA